MTAAIVVASVVVYLAGAAFTVGRFDRDTEMYPDDPGVVVGAFLWPLALTALVAAPALDWIGRLALRPLRAMYRLGLREPRAKPLEIPAARLVQVIREREEKRS